MAVAAAGPAAAPAGAPGPAQPALAWQRAAKRHAGTSGAPGHVALRDGTLRRRLVGPLRPFDAIVPLLPAAVAAPLGDAAPGSCICWGDFAGSRLAHVNAAVRRLEGDSYPFNDYTPEGFILVWRQLV